MRCGFIADWALPRSVSPRAIRLIFLPREISECNQSGGCIQLPFHAMVCIIKFLTVADASVTLVASAILATGASPEIVL